MSRCIVALIAALGLAGYALPAAAEMPPPLPKNDSSYTAGSLKVSVYGQPGRQALVFIPGYALGPWEFSREIAAYSANYTVYALTLPGFDGAPGARGPLFQTVAADFWKWMAAQNISKPILIGHSLGGTMAILLAEQHSELLKAVVAIDGLPILPQEDTQSADTRASNAKQMADAIGMIMDSSQFADAMASYSLPDMMLSSKDVSGVSGMVERDGVDISTSAVWMQEDMTLDLRPDLSKITVPVLVIAPYDDPIDGKNWPTPDAKKAYYAKLMTGDSTAQVQVITPSRHFVMLDQPQMLDAALDAFLKTQTT
ncbi:MAG TPA: alpha/beta hydrolase [Candidatus Baltobacteraceae bacterium]|nr:alpha/beta hydrolase [Candidatus Baltobacteraceae bacterium]